MHNDHGPDDSTLSHPMLESGKDSENTKSGARRFWERLRFIYYPARQIDRIEVELEDQINREQIPSQHGLSLLKNYTKFKDRSPFKNETGDKNLSYWEFGSITKQDGLPTNSSGQIKSTRVKKRDTFSTWLCRIQESMESREPGSLKLITLVEHPSRQDTGSLFAMRYKTFATVRGTLDELHLQPTAILLFVIASSWDMISQPCWPSSTPTSFHDFKTQEEPLPLSLRKYERAHDPPMYSCTSIVWGGSATRPGNMDPNRGENEVFLHWQRSPERFKNNIEVYVWEYHKTFPTFEYAKIMLSPTKTSEDDTRLLISFRSCHALESFARNRDDESATRRDGICCPTESLQYWLPLRETVLSICNVFDVMCQDTTEFLQACLDELNQMSVRGRQAPSLGKIKYMMHLEDCCEAAHEGIKHGLEVLDTLGKWVQEHEHGISFDGDQLNFSRLSSMRDNLGFFDSRLARLRKDLGSEQGVMRQHYQLTQESRLWRIQIIAAVFLPLSFATSIFGMNINAVEPPDLFLNTTQMRNESESLHADTQKTTNILASAMWLSSSQQNYDWITFAATAGCLLLALPICFAIGSIARQTIKLVTRYAVYWRVLVLAIATGIVFISIFGRWFPGDLMSWAHVACNVLVPIYPMLIYYKPFLTHDKRDSRATDILPCGSAFCVLGAFAFLDVSMGKKHIPVNLIPWVSILIYYLFRRRQRLAKWVQRVLKRRVSR